MTSPRPDEDDTRIVDKVIERLLPSVLAWFEDRSHKFDDPVSVEQLQADLRHAISDGGNGYEMAKCLDGLSGWTEIDGELVAILDKASGLRTSIAKAFVREWVRENGVCPRHRVGTAVSYLETHGTITGVIADLALYKFVADSDKGSRYFITREVPIELIDSCGG